MEKIESVFQDQEATGKTPLIVSRVPLAENSIESRLIAIWKDFFEIEDITSESDFFKLGGDSLKLIELLTIINQEFQVGLNISDFFSKKTIHNIGQLITKEMNRSASRISSGAETKVLSGFLYSKNVIPS